MRAGQRASNPWNRRGDWVHNAPMRLRSIARAASVIPPGLASIAAAMGAPWLGLALSRRRRAWIGNLRDLGDPGAGTLRRWPRPFYHHLLLAYESLARIGGRRFQVHIEGGEHLRESIARGRGVLLASLHMGNWIAGAETAAALAGRPVHSVAGVQWFRGWTADLRRTFRAMGIRIHGGRRPAAALLRALRRGEIVALQIDGDRHAEAGGIATRGLSALSSRSGAEILTAHCIRIAPGRFTVRFDPPLASDPAGRLDRVLREEMRDTVRARPHQWILFHRIELAG